MIRLVAIIEASGRFSSLFVRHRAGRNAPAGLDVRGNFRRPSLWGQRDGLDRLCLDLWDILPVLVPGTGGRFMRFACVLAGKKGASCLFGRF
jgi:hypothetical protein